MLLDPGIGEQRLVPTPDHPLGQAAEVLDQDQPEHRRHGPEFADGERSHRLEGLEEPRDPRFVELAVGVGDQGKGQRVDPRIPSDMADGQLRQLGVIAAGKVLLDLPEHVLDDMEVVRQPVGVDPSPLGTVDLADDPAVGPDQDLSVLGEPTKQKVAGLRLGLDPRPPKPACGPTPQVGPPRRVPPGSGPLPSGR